MAQTQRMEAAAILPPKPKKLATTHSCFDCKNDKLLQQRRSSPIAGGQQALFLSVFETALASLWDARASNQFDRISREPEAPLPERGLNGVA